mgnify:CR=1 FL=1
MENKVLVKVRSRNSVNEKDLVDEISRNVIDSRRDDIENTTRVAGNFFSKIGKRHEHDYATLCNIAIVSATIGQRLRRTRGFVGGVTNETRAAVDAADISFLAAH